MDKFDDWRYDYRPGEEEEEKEEEYRKKIEEEEEKEIKNSECPVCGRDILADFPGIRSVCPQCEKKLGWKEGGKSNYEESRPTHNK